MTDSDNELIQTIENSDSAGTISDLNRQSSISDDSASHKEEEPLTNTEQKTTVFLGPFSPVGFLVPGKIFCYEEFQLTFEFKIDKLSLKVKIRILIKNKYPLAD